METSSFYNKLATKPRRKLTIRVYVAPHPNISADTVLQEILLPLSLWLHRHEMKGITFIDSVNELNNISDYVLTTILGQRKAREIVEHLHDGNNLLGVDDDYSWTPLAPDNWLFPNRDQIKVLLSRQLSQSIGAHHAGLSREARESTEDEFKSGSKKLLISTSTLELGIDIGDVAAIIQYKLPLEAESVFQRIGRAGRSLSSLWTCLGIIVLPDSPIASLYLYNEELRRKLEDISALPPKKVGYLSRNLQFQYFLSALLAYGASQHRTTFITEDASLQDLYTLILDLSGYINRHDFKEFIASLGVSEVQDQVKVFLNIAKEVMEGLIQGPSSEYDAIADYIILIANKVKSLRENLWTLRSNAESLLMLCNKVFNNMKEKGLYGKVTEYLSNINEFSLKLVKETENLVKLRAQELATSSPDEYFKLIHGNHIKSLIGNVYEIAEGELKRSLRGLHEIIDKELNKIRGKSFMDLLGRFDFIKKFKDYQKLLTEINGKILKIQEILNYFSDDLFDLFNSIQGLNDKIEQYPGKLRSSLTLVKFRKWKRNLKGRLRTLELLEFLTIASGYPKFSPLLEAPSPKIELKRLFKG